MNNIELKPFEAMIAVFHYKCQRCGYAWQPKDRTRIPGVCPQCNTSKWQEPKKNRVKTNLLVQPNFS